jgi:DNA-binding GntR family transcriptional regulator
LLAGTIPVEMMPHWRALADKIATCADRVDVTGFMEADRDFHLGLLGLHGNGRLVAAVAELRSQTRMVHLAKMTQNRELTEAAREHHLMLDLLERGEGEPIQELMVRHLGRVVGWSAAGFEKSG